MIVTTTPSVEGKSIVEHHGVVVSETIMGANIFRDIIAMITDIIGGRSGAYEQKFSDARKTALRELETKASSMGANAVVGVSFDYEVVGHSGSILMVSVYGTAVTIR